ncbi:MAG: hypothetical protein ACTSPY_11870 [Candidatus Helarchaeota archaeon]
MKHFLIRMFENNVDEDIHKKVLRYSKGEHQGPRLEIVIKGKKIYFYADRDFDGYFLDFIINRIPSDSYKLSGNVIAPEDHSRELEEYDINISIKKSKGMFHIKIDDQIDAEKVKNIYQKFIQIGYPLLSISPSLKTNMWKITTKKTIPRPSGKTKDDKEEPKPNFCKGTIPKENDLLTQIIEDCFYDFIEDASVLKNLSFSSLHLENYIIVNEIILPDPELKKELITDQKKLNSLTKELNSQEISLSRKKELKSIIKELSKSIDERSRQFRLATKRKGEIKRILVIDHEKTYNNKFPFEA